MPELNEIKEEFKIEIDRISKRAIEMANYLFDNPEIGLKEYKSKDYLIRELLNNGFEVKEGVGGLETSFRAEYSFDRPGPTIAFIAEYDALNNLGHACHHHLIGSGSVNTAIALGKLGNRLCGKIVCVGTPAEEIMDAKGIMIKNGAFKGIDVSLMFHGGSRNNNKLIILAVDVLEFSYKGKAAHAAAAPHEGINALDAVILLFNSVNALRQQLKEDVRIHGNVVKGGNAVNIIPEIASARIGIRAQKRQYLNEVVEKVKNCARGASLQTGTELTISVFEDPGSDLLKNSYLNKEYEENFSSLGFKLDDDPFLLGSTDIGNLSHYMPAIHPMVKTAENCALHTVECLNYGTTELAYNGMLAGMKSIGMTGTKVLIDSEFLKNIKKEFNEQIKGL